MGDGLCLVAGVDVSVFKDYVFIGCVVFGSYVLVNLPVNMLDAPVGHSLRLKFHC